MSRSSRARPVTLAVEGPLDEAVLRRIAAEVGLVVGPVHVKRGKDALLPRLPAYNQAARFGPWVVLVDLNRSAECAPPFVRRHLPAPTPLIRFRVAVREVEAWLLADGERVASFLKIDLSLLPTAPERLPNPRETLLQLARRSPDRGLRDDLVPARPGTAGVGPGYNGRLIEFVGSRTGGWRPATAARKAESLRRCIQALRALRSA